MNSTLLALTVSLGLCITSGAFAQRTGSTTSSSAPRKYELQAKYNSGIAQSYLIEENTVAERTHSDSAKKQYNRNVKYYTTIRCIESQNGMSTIVVTLDSLQYKFSADGKDVLYDSQTDITPKNFADLNNYIGPLNRPYNLTMNPYGEVSKVEGEQVDFWRDYLNENKEGLDSVIYLIWMQSLDNDNLMHFGDLQKRIIPGKAVALDSTWMHELTLRLDGVIYTGKVSSKLDKYTGGLFVITTADTIKAAQQRFHVYGVPDISNLVDGACVVKSSTTMSTAGTINEVECEARSWYKAKVMNEEFTQRVVTTTTWKLTGQYQW